MSDWSAGDSSSQECEEGESDEGSQSLRPFPCALVVALFSRHRSAIERVRRIVESQWGAIALQSRPFAFEQTSYYQQQMGDRLEKEFWVLKRLEDPACLADRKRMAIAWEALIAESGEFPESRPVNIDPGWISPLKLVLASTKDRAHRIYLRDGIYAEVALQRVGSQWRGYPWTYPDYLLPDSLEFFQQAIGYLKKEAARPDSRGKGGSDGASGGHAR